MRAAILSTYGAPLEIHDRPGLEPLPGYVVLRVDACGVCGSDRFLQSGGFASTLPVVPGHEAAGTVTAVGEGVEGLRPGTPAAVYYIQHCGKCAFCHRGRPNLCVSLRRMGVDVDGAFATEVMVPEACVLPVPPEIEAATVAVLTDAVGTGYHALTSVARVQPGETVVVFGIGGIGSNVVQLAVHLGARVIAVSRQPSKLELATELGADEVVVSSGQVIEDIRALTGDRGPEVVVQAAGSAAVDRLAVEATGLGGRVVFVGASQDSFEVKATELIWREASLLGSRGFTPQDVLDVVELYGKGAIRVDHLVTRRRPLVEVNEALEDLTTGVVLRTVIEPHA